MAVFKTSEQLLEEFRRERDDAFKRAQEAQIIANTWVKAVSMLQDLIDSRDYQERAKKKE